MSHLWVCAKQGCECMYGVRWELGWTFIPCSEGMQWLFNAVGGISWDALVLLERGVMANQDKVVLSNHLHVETLLLRWEGTTAPLNGLMRMRTTSLVCCGSSSRQTSNQLNTFWSNPHKVVTALSTNIIKASSKWAPFVKLLSQPCRDIQRIGESMPRHLFGSIWWPNIL